MASEADLVSEDTVADLAEETGTKLRDARSAVQRMEWQVPAIVDRLTTPD